MYSRVVRGVGFHVQGDDVCCKIANLPLIAGSKGLHDGRHSESGICRQQGPPNPLSKKIWSNGRAFKSHQCIDMSLGNFGEHYFWNPPGHGLPLTTFCNGQPGSKMPRVPERATGYLEAACVIHTSSMLLQSKLSRIGPQSLRLTMACGLGGVLLQSYLDSSPLY